MLVDARVVALVGFMGAGKSTVGPELAQILGRPFVDLDRVVEGDHGATVWTIFAREGEASFRRLEAAALRGVLRARTPPVLACGGGTLERAENRRLLARRAIVVWLDAGLHCCLARAEPLRRPLLVGGTAAAARLLRARRPRYAAADVRVRAERGSPVEVARRIALGLRRLDRRIPGSCCPR